MFAIRSIQRRNAIIPFPLLPSVPSNTIVTSVRIVHNSDPSPPSSPAPTTVSFAPLTGGSAKRMRSGRRRSICTPCQDNCDSSLLNPNRKPRSTIVVTVRLANPAPSNASYGSRAPSVAPAARRPAQVLAAGPQVIGVGNAFAAMQARKMAYSPRVSSPLASSAATVSPLSTPAASARRYTKKNSSSKKGKTGGRMGMLRLAVLNNSGPEVGRRIVSMGPKLANEIWEAERVVKEVEAVESNEMEVKQEENIEASADCEEQSVREEMEVDSEDTVMEQSSTLEATATEKATETHQTENNRMDLDMPAPVAVVAPLSTVQIQVEIAVQVFSPAKKAQKDVEKSRSWFERIALY